MTPRSIKHLLRLMTVAAAVAFVLGSSTPAQAETHCFTNLASCFVRAAGADSYWQSVLASADCELDFVDCTRRAIIGR
jgi:ABC-type sugar transport system substrate-binding protein